MKIQTKIALAVISLLLLVPLIAYLLWQPWLGERVGYSAFRTAFTEVAERGTWSPEDTSVDGLAVGICGAGAPLPDPHRSGPCTYVQGGNVIFIVDVGSYAARNLAFMNVDHRKIEAVLLTHTHSDHFDGLGEFLLQSWIQKQGDSPMQVFGPLGTDQVVYGLKSAYWVDHEYRIAHHGEEVANPRSYGGEPVLLPRMSTPDASHVLYDKDGFKVTAFPVPHEPVTQAVGYRFDYKGRSVVISGDTRRSDAVEIQAQNVDLLLHEALQPKLVGVMQEVAEQYGNHTAAKIFADILSYHTSPEEIAEIAGNAGVGHLALHHIIPPLPSPLLERVFLGDARDYYDGPITITKNFDRFYLPADSDEVILD